VQVGFAKKFVEILAEDVEGGEGVVFSGFHATIPISK
jgi:hypothetical protein